MSDLGDTFKAMKEMKKELREKEEPKRLSYARKEIEKLGYDVRVSIGENSLIFEHNGSNVVFFPFSGWATGKTIKDGRGLKKLIKQLEK